MNTKKIHIMNEILTQQLNHWLLYPLGLAFFGALREIDRTALNPRPLQWFLFSLFPLVFFGLRCRIKHLFPFLLLHFAVGAAAFLIPLQSAGTRVACVVCGVGYMLYSAVLRLKHDDVYSDSLSLLAGIGITSVSILFLHLHLDIREWDNYYVFALIGSIVLFLLNFYLERYLHFIASNESSAGVLPAADIFHSGLMMVLPYTLLGALVLTLSSQFEWLMGILRPLKNLLVKFLRFLVSLLPASEPGEEIPIEGQMPGSMGPMELPKETEGFWLWDVLEYLFLLLGTCIVLFAVAALLWKLMQLIRKYLVLHSGEKEAAVFGDAVDIREKCGVEKEKERRRMNPFRSLSPREKIRKLYKEKLLSITGNGAMDKNLPGQYTAREWERKLSADGMAQLYERARYSPHEVTKADVKKMRENCSKLL